MQRRHKSSVLQVLAGCLSDHRSKQRWQTHDEGIWKNCNGSYQLDKIPCKQSRSRKILTDNKSCFHVLFTVFTDVHGSNEAIKATAWHGLCCINVTCKVGDELGPSNTLLYGCRQLPYCRGILSLPCTADLHGNCVHVRHIADHTSAAYMFCITGL